MERTLVFVPASRAEARELVTTPFSQPRQAFAVTAELLAALGYGPDQQEDAEYAALVLASVWGLAQWGERCVVVAELPEADVDRSEQHESGNGGVRSAMLSADNVVSVFTDEADVDLTAAAAASKGLDIDAAWEMPQVQDLVTEHDLLWHAADELALLSHQPVAEADGGQ